MKIPIQRPAACDTPVPFDLTSDFLISEVKADGSRYLLYIGFCPYGRREGTTLLSKQESGDHKYVDKTDQVPHIAKDYPELHGTIIDGEITSDTLAKASGIMNSTPENALRKQKETGYLKYKVWDVLWFKGEDLRSKPLSYRRQALQIVVSAMQNPHIEVVEWVTSDHKAHFDAVTARGGEGIVIKDIRQPYGQGWSKMKKVYDVSVIISGWKPSVAHPGTMGSISLSVYDKGELVEVASIGSIPVKLKEDMSRNFEAYKGRVVDIFAQEILKVSAENPCGRIRHATFNRFRDDMNPETCTAEKMYADLRLARANISRGGREYKSKLKYKKAAGRGNPESWARAAQSIMERMQGIGINEHIEALGLSEMPEDMKTLTKARNDAIRKAHPDLGGSHEDATKINQAYATLKKTLERS